MKLYSLDAFKYKIAKRLEQGTLAAESHTSVSILQCNTPTVYYFIMCDAIALSTG